MTMGASTISTRWMRSLAILLSAMLAVAVPVTAVAQVAATTAQSDEMAQYDATARRAEEAISSDGASITALESLQAELVTQRDALARRIERGSISSVGLQATLDALGPPPAAGATEPDLIATRRAELKNQIAEADAPLLDARQAHKRAEVLISAINKIIRERTNRRLFDRTDSPLNLSLWPRAATEVSSRLARIATEVGTILDNPTRSAVVKREWPSLVALVVAALALLLVVLPVGLRWIERPSGALRTRQMRVAATLLFRLIVPTMAAALLLTAWNTAEIRPWSLRSLSTVLPAIAAMLICSWWLSDVIFAPGNPARRVIAMSDARAARLTRIAFGLGVVLAGETVIGAVERDDPFTTGTSAILAALVVIAGSYLLLRFAGALRPASIEQDRSEAGVSPGQTTSGLRLLGLMVQALRIVAIVAVCAALVGYVQLARAAMLPAILSLGLAGLAIGFHRLVIALASPARNGTIATGLFPFALGVIEIILLVPLLALIWGARSTDLGETWRLMRDGIQIGDTRLSLVGALVLVGTFIIGVAATRWLKTLLGSDVLPRTRLDIGGQSAVLTGFSYVGFIISALVAVSLAGLDLSNLAIVAGALSVGIGFGMQAVVSNFISGIILLIERPIKQGDWIEVGTYSGIVKKIAVRSTWIETFDRNDVIVPNSQLITTSVVNKTSSTQTGRLIIPIGLAYGSDVTKARDIIQTIADNHPATLSDPPPSVLFMNLGDSALEFELRCIVGDVTAALGARSELLFEIYKQLDAAGIEIPFPQRVVTLSNPEALAQAITKRSGSDPA